jgi:hypothetical protein
MHRAAPYNEWGEEGKVPTSAGIWLGNGQRAAMSPAGARAGSAG